MIKEFIVNYIPEIIGILLGLLIFYIYWGWITKKIWKDTDKVEKRKVGK